MNYYVSIETGTDENRDRRFEHDSLWDNADDAIDTAREDHAGDGKHRQVADDDGEVLFTTESEVGK